MKMGIVRELERCVLGLGVGVLFPFASSCPGATLGARQYFIIFLVHDTP